MNRLELSTQNQTCSVVESKGTGRAGSKEEHVSGLSRKSAVPLQERFCRHL